MRRSSTAGFCEGKRLETGYGMEMAAAFGDSMTRGESKARDSKKKISLQTRNSSDRPGKHRRNTESAQLSVDIHYISWRGAMAATTTDWRRIKLAVAHRWCILLLWLLFAAAAVLLCTAVAAPVHSCYCAMVALLSRCYYD